MLIFYLIFTILTTFLFANSPHQFEMGPDIYYRSYSEKGLPDEHKSDEYGVLYGLYAAYNYVNPRSYYLGVEGSLSGGQTTYDGTLVNLIDDSTTPYKSNTDNLIYDAEIRNGFTFQTGQALLTPFVGVGYHFWGREIEWFRENYSWGYLSLGIRLERELSHLWKMGLNAKLMLPFNGRMVIPSYNNTVFQLGSTLQTVIEMPITYDNTNHSSIQHFRIVPYFQNQNIGQSNTRDVTLPGGFSGKAHEPASKTYVFGLRLECLF